MFQNELRAHFVLVCTRNYPNSTKYRKSFFRLIGSCSCIYLKIEIFKPFFHPVFSCNKCNTNITKHYIEFKKDGRSKELKRGRWTEGTYLDMTRVKNAETRDRSGWRWREVRPAWRRARHSAPGRDVCSRRSVPAELSEVASPSTPNQVSRVSSSRYCPQKKPTLVQSTMTVVCTCLINATNIKFKAR